MGIRQETTIDHSERINRVVQYMHEHIAEPLDLEKLASVSCYSPFHFHRILRAFLGESIGAYLIRIRLDASAFMLRMTDKAIADIAFEVGYDTPSSFNKAFRKRFGVSPGEFRDNRRSSWATDLITQKRIIMERKDFKPKTKVLKDKKVIYIQRIGNYNDTAGNAWDKVCAYAKEKRLFGMSTEFIGLSHDDPTVTEPEKCRYEACIAVSKEVKPEGEVGFKVIPGGKFLVFKFKGPYDKLGEAYNYIYGHYIPENKIELGEGCGFEKYLNSPEKTKPEKLQTEIYLPLK
jgi:AraC family transcriptional regulator